MKKITLALIIFAFVFLTTSAFAGSRELPPSRGAVNVWVDNQKTEKFFDDYDTAEFDLPKSAPFVSSIPLSLNIRGERGNFKLFFEKGSARAKIVPSISLSNCWATDEYFDHILWNTPEGCIYGFRLTAENKLIIFDLRDYLDKALAESAGLGQAFRLERGGPAVRIEPLGLVMKAQEVPRKVWNTDLAYAIDVWWLGWKKLPDMVGLGAKRNQMLELHLVQLIQIDNAIWVVLVPRYGAATVFAFAKMR